MEELHIYTKEEKLDYLGIAETWLHDTVENGEIRIEEYCLYRRDETEIKSGTGGGSAYMYETPYHLLLA